MKAPKSPFPLHRLLLAAVTISVALTVPSCKDDTDDTAPEITLQGDETVNLFLQSTWIDPGALAIDDNDGVVNVTTTGSFNVNKTGTYFLTYTATDVAGNSATKTRTIEVTNELTSSSWVGTYSCEKFQGGVSQYTYNDSLGYSKTLNNQLAFQKFDNRGNADALFNIKLSSPPAVDPYNQIITGGTPTVTVNYAGAGITSTGPDQILLQVSETVNSVTTDYTYVMTKN